MARLGLCCCPLFPLVAASGGSFLVGVPGLLIAVASLIVVHRLWGAWAQYLRHRGSVFLFLTSRAQAQQVCCTGLVAPSHVVSSQTRGCICVSLVGWRMLYHQATREVTNFVFFPTNDQSVTSVANGKSFVFFLLTWNTVLTIYENHVYTWCCFYTFYCLLLCLFDLITTL